MYLSLLFGSAVHAQTKYLLIDGGASKSSNYSRYYNSVLTGYEVLKGKGKQVSVIAKDGKWTMASLDEVSSGQQANIQSGKLVYPAISSPARDLNDIRKALSSYKDGDTLYLHFTSHGGGPSKPGHPESSTLSLFGNDVSYEDLAGVLKEFPNLKFKIYSGVCYGGGIHHLARSLKNVCSSSAVPYFTQSYSGSPQMNVFEFEFWKSIKSNNRPSLASASLDSFEKDIANIDLGSLSSFDYVDFVLKKGPYGKTYDELPSVRVNANSIPRDPKDPPLWAEGMLKIAQPNGYRSISSTVKTTAQIVDCNTGSCCASTAISNDITRLKRLSETLNEVVQQSAIQDLRTKAERQPAEVRTIFHNVIDDMKKNGQKYLQISNQYQQKYKELVGRWNAHKEKFKDSWGITKWWYGEGEERAKIQKEFDVLKANAQRDLKQYSFDHQMLERLDRLDEFNKKATPKQKEKFVQLLQCEWEPI
ncbi:MAG: hypothetical protein J0L82_18140 [Deltaproteobacteria bacterium]|nr:hypothetical protein [Deltaproteobacteria bacterium]